MCIVCGVKFNSKFLKTITNDNIIILGRFKRSPDCLKILCQSIFYIYDTPSLYQIADCSAKK